MTDEQLLNYLVNWRRHERILEQARARFAGHEAEIDAMAMAAENSGPVGDMQQQPPEQHYDPPQTPRARFDRAVRERCHKR